MDAHPIDGDTTADRRPQLDRLVTHAMVSALQVEPGFAGAPDLVDRDSGAAMAIVLWDTEAQARGPLADHGAPFLRALAGIAAISAGTRRPISVWDVGARA